MKKAWFPGVIAAAIALLLYYGLPLVKKQRDITDSPFTRVLVVYQSENKEKAPHILDAYRSVLEEEGVPHEVVDVYHLLATSAKDVASTAPAIILPDGILQTLPLGIRQWIKDYLDAGGNAAVIYDVGVKHSRGYYLDMSLLADITGINLITFKDTGALAYGRGAISFATPAHRDAFQIPFGKTLDGVTLSGYGYGRLSYPFARTSAVRKLDTADIYAYAVTDNGDRYPAIVLTRYGNGKVLYVNTPLGYMKGNSDDLPLRAALRTFLFDIVSIPHVMNVEAGKGSLVINWHIDSNAEFATMPWMFRSRIARSSLPASFHITAGEFSGTPGHIDGFDACGKGRALVEEMMRYGAIGSHGGWGHDWFAKNIEEGRFGEKEITQYIEKNNACLESITGSRIIEYSAPVGVHPQPLMTRVIERLGMIAYYSNGDTGSGPNRAFIDGRMVSDKVIAFPVMPFGKTASLYEMAVSDRKAPADVKRWFHETLRYIADNRTVRLIYSHPYNFTHYPAEVKDFISTAEQMQKSGTLSVRTMGDHATFFRRFLGTTHSFRSDAGGLTVRLSNPDGLRGIAVALPKKGHQRPADHDLVIEEDAAYYYVTVNSDVREKSISAAAR